MSNVKKFVTIILVSLALALAALGAVAIAEKFSADSSTAIVAAADTNDVDVSVDEEASETSSEEQSSTGTKAIAAGIAVGLAAAVGAIAMGIAISKASESIARQPEAEGKIRSTMMLGLVFIETAIIYALIVAILIIFVL